MTAKEHDVEIILDGVPTKIAPGTYTQAHFKDTLHIDPSKVIDIFVHGKFEPAPEPIDVRAGEKFATHVPRGGSSWR